MTPENRARMQSVLRDSLRRAYLPGSPAHAHGGGTPHAHGHAHTHLHSPPPKPIAGTVTAATPLTSAGTPATSIVSGDPEALATRFCEELEALAGMTYRADSAEAAAEQIAAIVARTGTAPAPAAAQPAGETGTGQIVSWSEDEIGLPGLEVALAARGLTFAPPGVPFADPERTAQLDPLAALNVGLTGAQAAIAESGSLVLVSGPGRGRLASLLTPVHIAILRRDRILPTLTEVFRAHRDLTALGSNLVFITGPSRTADIEMTLSRGVHGPREIHVILV